MVLTGFEGVPVAATVATRIHGKASSLEQIQPGDHLKVSGNAVIEVKSAILASGATYSEELTPGNYTVNASTADRASVESGVIAVTPGGEFQLDFTL